MKKSSEAEGWGGGMQEGGLKLPVIGQISTRGVTWHADCRSWCCRNYRKTVKRANSKSFLDKEDIFPFFLLFLWYLCEKMDGS